MKKALVLVIMLSVCLFAQQTRKEKLINSMLVAMDLDAEIQKSLGPALQQVLPTLAEQMGVKEDDPMLLEMMDSIKVIAREALAHPRIKDKFIAIFSEVLTEEEAEIALQFYSTSAGKKIAANYSLFTEKAAKIGEEAMQAEQGRIEAAFDAIADRYQVVK